MPEEMNLQEQFELPLVKDVNEENERLLSKIAELEGTKIPDNKIEKIKIPYTIKNKLLMNEGDYNGVFYSALEVKKSTPTFEGCALVYDHKDTEGEGASAWLGKIENAVWDESGSQGPGIYGDLIIADKPAAQKLAAGAKWGISPAIDFQRNELDGKIVGTDLLMKSCSFVLTPAVRETMLNAKKNKEGEPKMTEEKKVPYTNQADNLAHEDEAPKKKIKKKPAPEELMVNERTKEVLDEKDAEISRLQKIADTIETDKKTVMVSELVANEYLIGRLEEHELVEREKALMEMSADVLKELAAVVGSHNDLKKFLDFKNEFNAKTKVATLKEMADAWKVALAKLNDGDETGAEGAEQEKKEGADAEGDKETKEEKDTKAAGAATLTGDDKTPEGKELATLQAKMPDIPITQADSAMAQFLVKAGGGK